MAIIVHGKVKKMKKVNPCDLYMIFSICGSKDRNLSLYISGIRSVLQQKKAAEPYKIHVVVSAYKSSQKIIDSLKQEFGSDINYCEYFTGKSVRDRSTSNDTIPVQGTFNKTVQVCVEKFGMPSAGFGYVTSGVTFPEGDIVKRAIDKLLTDNYGIIQCQISGEVDHGYQYLGMGPTGAKPGGRQSWSKVYNFKTTKGFWNIDFTKDYHVPPGCAANFHTGFFHTSFYTSFDKKIGPDIFGRANFEAVLSYLCASIGKTYILMGDSMVHHKVGCDGPGIAIGGDSVKAWLLFGRTPAGIISAYKQAKHLGFGFLPGHAANVPQLSIYPTCPHDQSCFDDKYLCKNNELKNHLYMAFYTNKNELDYDKIPYLFS